MITVETDEKMDSYDFDFGCLTGFYGHFDADAKVITELGYYYESDLWSKRKVALIASVVSVGFCFLIAVMTYFFILKPRQEEAEKNYVDK